MMDGYGDFLKIGLDGHKELLSALAELPDAMARPVLERALRKAVQPTVAAAKEEAPKDSGDMAKSIRSRKLPAREAGEVAVAVGPAGGDGNKAHLIELGTADRTVKSTNRDVGHVAPNPFLRRAWDRTEGDALARFAAEITVQLRKVAQRIQKRLAKGTLGKTTIRRLTK